MVEAVDRLSSDGVLAHKWLGEGKAGSLPNTPLSPMHGKHVKNMKERKWTDTLDLFSTPPPPPSRESPPRESTPAPVLEHS